MRKATIAVLVLVCASIFCSAPAAAEILWNNGPLVTCEGCGDQGADISIVQGTTLGMTTIGMENSIANDKLHADDFTVTGEVWDVTRLTVFVYQSGAPVASTIDDFRYQIWNGPPNDPASSVVYGTLTNSITDSDWANTYRVLDTIPAGTNSPVMRVFSELSPGTLLLPPGVYWLVWQTGGSGTYSGPWQPPVTVAGQTNTGNGLYSQSGFWSAAKDAGTGAPQGLPFAIEGSKVASFYPANGVVSIPVVSIRGTSKSYKVEMLRTPNTLDFTVTNSSKIP